MSRDFDRRTPELVVNVSRETLRRRHTIGGAMVSKSLQLRSPVSARTGSTHISVRVFLLRIWGGILREINLQGLQRNIYELAQHIRLITSYCQVSKDFG